MLRISGTTGEQYGQEKSVSPSFLAHEHCQRRIAGCRRSARGARRYLSARYLFSQASGIGDVVVTMTFDSNKITDVVLDVSHETPNIGQAAAKQLRQSLLKAQSADIDAVSGASITFLRPFTRRPPSASHRPKVKFPLKSSPRPKRPTTATGSVSRPKLRKKTLSIRSRRKFS